MRLLFDEQLSEELIVLLHDIFPDSLHVRQLGAGGSPDQQVWQLAREHECVLITKDEDFHRLSVLQSAPPKVVGFACHDLHARGHAGRGPGIRHDFCEWLVTAA